MPFIHLTLATPLAPAPRAALAAELTGAIARLLGKRREVTAVRIEAVDAAGWYVDALPPPAGETPAHADIFITAGSNTVAEKEAMIAATHAALVATLGELPLASYVVIHEIAAGDWGYSGLSQAARRRTGSGL